VRSSDFVQLPWRQPHPSSPDATKVRFPFDRNFNDQKHPRHAPQYSGPAIRAVALRADCLTKDPKLNQNCISSSSSPDLFSFLRVLASASLLTCYRFVATANRVVLVSYTGLRVVGFITHSTFAERAIIVQPLFCGATSRPSSTQKSQSP
jgi:hypothetical protein